MMEKSTALADRVSELWSDERCVWRMEFDLAAPADSPWTVDLEWTDERDAPHEAEWATYIWRFGGETPEVALAETVAWLERLLPFERCGACDGAGAYGLADSRSVCDECCGSGLANEAA